MSDKHNPRLGTPPDHKGDVGPNPSGTAPSGSGGGLPGPGSNVSLESVPQRLNMTAIIIILLTVAAVAAIPLVITFILSPGPKPAP